MHIPGQRVTHYGGYIGSIRMPAGLAQEARTGVEAAGGLEPPNKGFAALCLSHLATPPSTEQPLPHSVIEYAEDKRWATAWVNVFKDLMKYCPNNCTIDCRIGAGNGI